MERYRLNEKQVTKINDLQNRKKELMEEIEIINIHFKNLYFLGGDLYSSVPLKESEDTSCN